jgi:mRNA interferase MazF
MTKGRIVLVPFPFDDLTGFKVRPVLCLTNPIGPYRHVVMAFISSRVLSDIAASEFIVDPQQADFSATGLRVASVIRLHRLITLPLALIRRDMGQLSPPLQAAVDAKILALFELK